MKKTEYQFKWITRLFGFLITFKFLPGEKPARKALFFGNEEYYQELFKVVRETWGNKWVRLVSDYQTKLDGLAKQHYYEQTSRLRDDNSDLHKIKNQAATILRQRFSVIKTDYNSH